MTTSKLLFASVAVMALLTSPLAFADHHGKGGKGGKMFEKHDADGDGKISAAEHIAAAQERFKKMDADGDGYITKEEAKAAHEKMREKFKEKHKKHENDVE